MNKNIARSLIIAVLLVGVGQLGVYICRNQPSAYYTTSLNTSIENDGPVEASSNRVDGEAPTPIDVGIANPANTYEKQSDKGKEADKSSEKPAEKTVSPDSKPQSPVNNSPAVAESTVGTSRSRSVQTSSNYSLLSKNKGVYGQFAYRNTSGGRIEIDPQWVKDNIVTITLPGLNRQVKVNKAAQDKFIKAFTYIKNGSANINGKTVPLLSLIKSMDGTFVPRHVNWSTANGLSNHSWGIAIDINASDHYRYVNPYSEPNDPNLILWEKAFRPAGFSWGNSYRDSMHFELDS